MKFIKKHKVGLIVLLVTIILMVLVFFAVKEAFFANIDTSKYGNRLDGIEKYPVESSMINDIKNRLDETGYIEDFSYDVQGRIINFIIKVKEDVDIEKAHSLAPIITENINDDYKAFYDIQVMITSANAESEGFPTIGYKHKLGNDFKWNNN